MASREAALFTSPELYLNSGVRVAESLPRVAANFASMGVRRSSVLTPNQTEFVMVAGREFEPAPTRMLV